MRPRPVAIWWVVDVALVWIVRTEGIVIRIQRIVVHRLLLLLFLVGSIGEGSYPISVVSGVAMGASVLGAIVVRLRGARTGR